MATAFSMSLSHGKLCLIGKLQENLNSYQSLDDPFDHLDVRFYVYSAIVVHGDRIRDGLK